MNAPYLISTGETYQDIAKTLDIAPDLLSRWTQLPHFIAVLNTHRQAYRDEQQTKLESLLGKAVSVLDEILESGSTVEKLRAVQILLDKVELVQPLGKIEIAQDIAEELSNSPNTSVSPVAQVVEHESLEDIDETILEECLEDLQAYLDGEMQPEKAKARLYPIIDPGKLTLITASATLPAVKNQVEANHAKHSFVGKV